MKKANEKTASAEWEDICNSQGWDEESQVLHLEAFIKNKKLMGEFAAYARAAAAEENESSEGPPPRLVLEDPPALNTVMRWLVVLEIRGLLQEAIGDTEYDDLTNEQQTNLQKDWDAATEICSQYGVDIEIARTTVLAARDMHTMMEDTQVYDSQIEAITANVLHGAGRPHPKS